MVYQCVCGGGEDGGRIKVWVCLAGWREVGAGGWKRLIWRCVVMPLLVLPLLMLPLLMPPLPCLCPLTD